MSLGFSRVAGIIIADVSERIQSSIFKVAIPVFVDTNIQSTINTQTQNKSKFALIYLEHLYIVDVQTQWWRNHDLFSFYLDEDFLPYFSEFPI